MKYILTEKGYFSHIGTDPVVNAIALEDDKNFSFENQPTKFHKWNGDEFALDYDLFKQDLINQAKQSVFNRCDYLKDKILRNESYSYAENYQQVKEDLIQQVKMQRVRISTFETLTVEELRQIIANV